MQNQSRIVIENITPQINNGKVFIKRVVDEIVNVTADVLVDGHDVLQANLLFKHETDKNWSEVRMSPTFNDILLVFTHQNKDFIFIKSKDG
jgi:starch synthase (maltosyl-transferring)